MGTLLKMTSLPILQTLILFASVVSADDTKTLDRDLTNDQTALVHILREYQSEAREIATFNVVLDLQKLNDPEWLENAKESSRTKICKEVNKLQCEKLVDSTYDEILAEIGQLKTFSRYESPGLFLILLKAFGSLQKFVPEHERPSILFGTLPSACFNARQDFAPDNIPRTTRLLVFDQGLSYLVQNIAALTAAMFDTYGDLKDVHDPVGLVRIKSAEELGNDGDFISQMRALAALYIYPNFYKTMPSLQLNAKQSAISGEVMKGIFDFIVAHEYSHVLLRHPSSEREIIDILRKTADFSTFSKTLEVAADANAAELLATMYGGRISGNDERLFGIAAYFSFLDMLDRAKGTVGDLTVLKYKDHPKPLDRLKLVLERLKKSPSDERLSNPSFGSPMTSTVQVTVELIWRQIRTQIGQNKELQQLVKAKGCY